MGMRITSNMQFDSTVGSMGITKRQYNAVLEKLTTQKEVNRISDDPMVTARIMDLKDTNIAIDQYSRNIDNTGVWVTTNDLTLNSVNEWIRMAKDLALPQASGAGGEQTAEERGNIGDQIAVIKEQILSLANSKLGDRYLFGGSKTDVEPFSSDVNGVVTYDGNDEDLFVSIGKSSKTAYNVTGEAAFTWQDGADTVDVFKVLDDLKTAIEADPQDVDGPDGITAQIGKLEEARDQVEMAVSQNADAANKMEMAKNTLADLQKGVTSLISKNEDADVAELAMELSMKDLSLQACYGIAAKLQENSLLSFLK